MPYIAKEIRSSLDDGRKSLTGAELNYQFTKLVNDFLAMRGVSYAVLGEVAAAFSLAEFEFKRRIVAPYEDKKIIANGEVYVFQEEKA